MHPFQTLALSAGLLGLAGTARSQQVFSAGAAVGIELDQQALVDPGAVNVDAAEIFGVDTDPVALPIGFLARGAPAPPPPPPPELPDIQRQDLITVGPFVRTCPCTKVRPSDLVRTCILSTQPGHACAMWCQFSSMFQRLCIGRCL